MLELMAKIEAYGFECEAGPLVNCTDWQKLCEEIIVREALAASRTKSAE